MTKAIQIAAAAFLITAGILKAAPALAEPAVAATNVSFVHTADLDLSSASGQRVLDVRLAQAARDVCGTASDVDLAGKNDIRQCRKDVLAKARGEREQLIAAAAGHGGVITFTNAR